MDTRDSHLDGSGHKGTCPAPLAQHPFSQDKGNYITTFKGKQVHVPGLRGYMIDLDDIIHSLSLQCRYLGHTTKFYSIAEHSVLVAEMARYCDESVDVQVMCLCHDFQEAYIGDFPSPFKRVVVGLTQFEDSIEGCTRDTLGMPPNYDPRWAKVKKYDRLALHYEGLRLFNTPPQWCDPTFLRANLGVADWRCGELGMSWEAAEIALKHACDHYGIRTMMR